MFRRKPQQLNTILGIVLRNQGLETPLRQRRLIAAWDDVVRDVLKDKDLAEYIIESTGEKEIKNQTLWVKLDSPAARNDLQMRQTEMVNKLNNKVGAQIICRIKLY